MSSMNPYAAPRSSDSVEAAGGGFVLKWIYLAVAAIGPLCVIGSRTNIFSLDIATLVGIFAASPFAKGAVGLTWLYRAWSALPEQERRVGDGELVTPLGVVGRMFIPVYGVYWMFAANTSLCAAIDRVLMSAGRGRATDASIAQVAAGGQLAILVASFLPPLVALGAAALVSGAWFLYMFQTDKARAHMEDALRLARSAV
jgi:hypothetical protein